MQENSDAIAAFCRLVLDNMPHSEIHAAVLAAEFKAEWLKDPRVQMDGTPIALLALSGLSVMFDQYTAYIAQYRNAKCPN